MLWIETPTNPLMKVCDIAALAEVAHSQGALLVVDNTFMSPFFQRPLSLGADIVVHSTTKFLNGHSDSVGGVAVVRDEAHAEKLRFVQNAAGAILSPFDSCLVLRGTKTLHLRMPRHEENTCVVAPFLYQHPKVSVVYWPGLPDHPNHEIHKRQCSGFGALVSFDLGHARGGGAVPRDGEAVLPRGEPRRGRDPDLPPRHHDPRRLHPGGARPAGDHRRAGAHQRGLRGRRRSRGRPGPGPRRHLNAHGRHPPERVEGAPGAVLP